MDGPAPARPRTATPDPRPPETNAEVTLRLLLRWIGSASLCAITFVVLPTATLAAIHRDLGLGPFPEGPIVEYLARSLSAFYALTGALLWAISLDLRRYRPLVGVLGGAFALLGLTLLGTDLAAGLPSWWTWWEGPFVTIVGLGILVLWRGIPPT